MFCKKAYTSAHCLNKVVSHASVRNFSKFSHSRIIWNNKRNSFVISATAISLSLYVLIKKKVICDSKTEGNDKWIENKTEIIKNYQYNEAIRKSRDVLLRIKDEYGIPGLVIGVSIDGETVWSEGLGYADVENRVLCTTDTVMRIASISKSITMAAVAKLWEQGKLDLDKPIQEYVPSFPVKSFDGKPVTITCRHLVSHLGGIRHYNREKKTNGKKDKEQDEMDLKEYYETVKYNDVASALSMFKDDPLIENPGTKFLYSTHGWTLISAVVEAVAKEQFTQHVTKLFKALGMEKTYLDENDVLIYNRSRNYMKSKRGHLINAPYVDNSYKWAGGGFLSTVGDLLQFANAMLYSLQFQPLRCDPSINKNSVIQKNQSNTVAKPINEINKHNLIPGYLTPKTMRTLWEPVPITKNYGMGWFVSRKQQECQFCARSTFCAFHTGGAIGASSVLLIVPKDEIGDNSNSTLPKGIVVALLTNMHSIGLSQTALKIARLFENGV